MEIEKTRETTWKIRLKNDNEVIELTSVEISGEVRNVKLALRKEKEIITVLMSKDEFFNFLSLITAFKDVIIDEDINYLQNQLDNVEIYDENKEVLPKNENVDDFVDKEYSDKESDDLNPEEWDPW